MLLNSKAVVKLVILIMSTLTETLEKIVNWLEVHYPENLAYLSPGLTNQQIEELTYNLPFTIPKEVRELYQYCDGSFGLDPSLVLYPLEYALRFYSLINYAQPSNNFLIRWFGSKRCLRDERKSNLYKIPIFAGDGKDLYYILCTDEIKESSSVWYADIGGTPELCTSSVTDLVLAILECYETGAFYVDYLDDDRGGKMKVLEENYEKSQTIFDKYQPEECLDLKCYWERRLKDNFSC